MDSTCTGTVSVRTGMMPATSLRGLAPPAVRTQKKNSRNAPAECVFIFCYFWRVLL